MSYNKINGRKEIILITDENFEQTWETLIPGFYKLHDSGGMGRIIPTFTPIEEKDDLINFTEGVIQEIIEDLNFFFHKITIEKYKKLHLTHKAGLLLYGKPGTGKTCTNHLIMNMMVRDYNAICLDVTDKGLGFVRHTIGRIREKQDNPIVLFYDEFDEVAQETCWLPFLDGNDSVDKLLFIGCTNNMKDIPKRIKDRKSRIRWCKEITSLPYQVYLEYVMKKLPDEDPKVWEEFASLSVKKGVVIDQLKNAILDYYIDGYKISKAIDNCLKTVVEVEVEF